MHKPLSSMALAVSLLAVPALMAGCAADDDPDPDPLELQLDDLRATVDAYHDVDAAEAAGYIPMSPCEEEPELGAMGIHYGHPDKLMAPIDPDDPPILLYIPDGDGLRLAGVEFFAPVMVEGAPHMGDEDTPPPAGYEPAEPPEVFEGYPFDGPMPGHSEEMPWHYDQHIWLFDDNPDGMFAAWNPALSCE